MGFSYTFTRAKQCVRFAVALPYLQASSTFLDRHRGNPI
jgi:hypothetical protein